MVRFKEVQGGKMLDCVLVGFNSYMVRFKGKLLFYKI